MRKNITLSADDDLIRRARERARAEKTSLNARFRRWLAAYAGRDRDPESAYEELMDTLSYARAGRSFSRDEMNER